MDGPVPENCSTGRSHLTMTVCVANVFRLRHLERSLSERRDLKTTVNLPRTNFAMKANLPENEPNRLAVWSSQDVYRKIREARRGAPLFVLHDGPPYANNNIHLG